MRRSTIAFIIIALLMGGLFALSRVSIAVPPVTLTVAVDSLAEAWLREAATQFNASKPTLNGLSPISVSITTANEMQVWQGKAGYSASTHPQAWIPSHRAAVEYAQSVSSFRLLVPSLARSPLVWGGFQSRVAVITADGAQAFDWPAVIAAAQTANWETLSGGSIRGFVNIGIAWPSSSMGGYGALLLALDSLQDGAPLEAATLASSSFASTFSPLADALQNAQKLGNTPAKSLATRGTSAADVALLPEAEWLPNLGELARIEPMVFAYPETGFTLDFPLAIWEDASLSADQRQAVQQFADFIQSSAIQALAPNYGLRPVNGDPADTAALFATAAPYGIQPQLPGSIALSIPNRQTAEQALRLLD